MEAPEHSLNGSVGTSLINMARWFEYFPVEPGDFVVDIGSCVGDTVLYFSRKVGKNGAVVALEPEINNYSTMCKLFFKYDCSNVIPIFAGIAKETGKTYLNIGGWNAHSTTFNPNNFQGKRVVPVISWDDLVEALAIPHVHLCKINAEGAEVEFLEGMSKVYPKKLEIDEHSRFGVDTNYLLQLLDEKGYKIVHRHENLIYAELV